MHIGKCGGSTVNSLLDNSPFVQNNYSNYFESHINGVNTISSCDYLFVLRNPIRRAFSAFEWRKKLVIDDKNPEQQGRFSGEQEVLKKYISLGNMARLLYRSDGSLDQKVARDFNLIHHLRESIHFYINPLVSILSTENILGVICQELLAEDCSRILGVDATNLFCRRNDSKTSIHSDLDVLSVANLRRFLFEDYQCIIKLWSLGAISNKQLSALLDES